MTEEEIEHDKLLSELTRTFLRLDEKKWRKIKENPYCCKGMSVFKASLEMHLDWLNILNQYETMRIINGNLPFKCMKSLLRVTRSLRKLSLKEVVKLFSILREHDKKTEKTK